MTPESRRLAGATLRSEPLAPVTLRAGGAAVTPELVSGTDDSSAPMLVGPDVSLTEFAGRQSELGTLMAAVESAVAGEGQFVTVVGEAGAGKSRLLYELRRQLDRSGVELFEGRCQSHGEGVPYLPLIQACRLALDVRDEDPPELQLEKVVERARSIDPALEGLLPLFLQLLAIPSDRYQLPDHLEGKPFRHAMQEALAALFTLASRLQPIVLLLEDWHWVDEASHDVVRQLVEMCPEYRLLVVVSYRPEASPDWSSAAEPRSIHLGALGPVSSLAIMRSVLEAQEVDDELARRVHERTGGNPFFLEEVCRTLREEGVVEIENGRARIAGDRQALQLPESVQAVIRTRLDRIEPAARDLLRTASVVGREFSLDVLRRVVDEGLDLDALLPVLKERGLVRQARVVPEPVFRFQHALTQEVAYDSLLQRQRKELHGRVGEAIEQIQRDTRDQDYDALARHFAEAETWSKAVHYGQLAARRAQGLSQFADALNVLEHSREWLRKIPPSDETKELWITLLQEQARVSEVVGDLRRQQQAIDELLDLLADDEDRPERVLAHLGRAELLALSRDYGDSERALDEALAASRRLGQSELERDALRSLAFVLWQRQRNEDALDALDKALAIDRGRGATSQMVSDLTNRASVLRGLKRHEEALESLEEALRYADQPGGNPDRLVEALYVMYTIYRMMGETEKGEPYLRRALAVQSQRFTIHQPFQSSALANILVERGEVEDALALLRTSVERSRQSRYAFGLSRCQLNLAQVLLGLGREEEALPHLVEAAEIFAQLRDKDSEVQALAAAAPILEKGGDPEAARRSWERVREATEDGEPRVEACRGLGRLAAAEGRWAPALVHLREAVELCTALDSELRGELLNEIGILEWKRGRYDEALDSYRQALAIYERSGEDVKAGVVLNSIGATLVRSGDAAEAVTTLERALTLHEQTGQQLLRGHALALLGDLALDAGDVSRAHECYRESLDLRKRTGDRRGEGWMRYQLARCHQVAGQRDSALENLELARAIAVEVADTELADSCGTLELE